MKITIIGTGYVGLVTGACLAEIGHDVFCLDVDPRKIEILNNGGVPIHEPGLLEMIARTRKARRITFSTDIEASVAHGEVQFIAVGTPPDEDGSADLQYVLEAARNIGRTMNGFKVIVDKSTVPVGTAQRVRAVIEEELAKRGLANSEQHRFSVVSNPEFLKEGAAVDDFMRPDRIVLGSDEDEAGLRARELMKRLYAPFNRNHERTLYMDVRSAEFTKYAANAMLATRISFMNEMSNLADRVGADIEAVRRGIGSDPRIGYHFLYAGCGYGGSCFPKDVQALIRTASESGHNLRILEAVEEVNYKQKDVLVRKITGKLGEDLSGRTFAVWGLAFKPNTDDMRLRSRRGGRSAPRIRPGSARCTGPARASHVHEHPGRNAHRRRCAGGRHRMERIQEPGFPASEISAEVTADFRRPQSVRAGRDDRARHRLSLDRTTLCPAL
jgi:UDPglucose 6-dehydrogenase